MGRGSVTHMSKEAAAKLIYGILKVNMKNKKRRGAQGWKGGEVSLPDQVE